MRTSTDGEILGLRASNNCRCCDEHFVCGSQVVVGDEVTFRLIKIIDDLVNEEEDAVKVVLLNADGVEGCTVGFLSRFIAFRASKRGRYINKRAKVMELYKILTDYEKKRKNLRGFGVASFHMVPVPKINIETATVDEESVDSLVK
jgi:hypothetical protein